MLVGQPTHQEKNVVELQWYDEGTAFAGEIGDTAARSRPAWPPGPAGHRPARPGPRQCPAAHRGRDDGPHAVRRRRTPHQARPVLRDLRASGDLEGRTNPAAYAAAEGLEIGSDGTVPVAPDYQSPAVFTGTIHEVAVDVGSDQVVDHDVEARIARYRQ